MSYAILLPMTSLWKSAPLVALLALTQSCSPARSFHDTQDDGGSAGMGGGTEGGVDVATDAVHDTSADTSGDTGSPDTSTDTAVDTSSDTGSDTGESDACVPLACQSAGIACGTLPDGCGGTLDCGGCPGGVPCGSGGIPNQCPGLPCPLPWGGSLPNGQSTTAYLYPSALSPDLCTSHMETRTCNDGILSGSYTHPSCTQTYRDCTLTGYGTLTHGQQVSSYAASSVPCGQTCTQVTISCDDGTLSGGSAYVASCTVSPCCTDDGISPELAALGASQNCGPGSPRRMIQANTMDWSGCCGYLVRECNVAGTSSANRLYCDLDADTWCNGVVYATNLWKCTPPPCSFGHAKGFSDLSAGTSCSSSLTNVNTSAGCTGGVAYYSSFGCTYTCDEEGWLTRSYGAPCEMGNGTCGGSVSTSSTTTCP